MEKLHIIMNKKEEIWSKQYFGFIYLTTNLVNGKKYIGKKQFDKKNEWSTYLGSGVILKKAIDKYGKDNFNRIIIDLCDNRCNMNICEQYWIERYNAVYSYDFYNIAKGGDGGWVNCGKSEEEIRKMYDSRNMNPRKGEDSYNSKLTNNDVLNITDLLLNGKYSCDIARKYNVSKSTIDDIRYHRTWKHFTEGYDFPEIDKNKSFKQHAYRKKIDVYDLDGNFIKTYSSAREINEQLNIGYRLVSQVCKGEKRQSHGYIFRFQGDAFDKYNVYLKNTKINQYSCDKTFIKTFDSIIDAANSVGSSYSNIRCALTSKSHYAKGFLWLKYGELF